MRALVLAAGLGKRMRPLTETLPKPLLQAGGRPLITYHLSALREAGIRDVVINTHWLAEMLPEQLGSGERWGLRLHYRHEACLLETAGGIINNLDLLSPDGKAPFLVINSDVYTELNLSRWLSRVERVLLEHPAVEACLSMVPNPDHHPEGDFVHVAEGGLLQLPASENDIRQTYAGIGVFRPAFFKGLKPGPRALGPVLKDKIRARRVFGLGVKDFWLDVGSPGRLERLQNRLSAV